MTKENNDHDTWVYHALREAKVVKYSEALELYKNGWRDSPDPKVLYKGVRGKWYKLIVNYRSLITHIKPHWDSYKIVVVALSVMGLIIALIKIS